jgi:hypothetical protein
MQVYERIEAALAYPVAEKSLPLFKELIRGPRRQQLLQVFQEEMAQLDVRAANGDTMTAVMAMLSSGKKSKL